MLSDEPLHAGFPEHKSKSNGDHPYRPRVAIFWNMETCPIPVTVRPDALFGNIRDFLQGQAEINWRVPTFCAYADFRKVSSEIKEGCLGRGIRLRHIPGGNKDDACGEAILADLFLDALDNPGPFSIMLISGGFRYAQALGPLRLRGYSVLLVIPSRVDVSPSLIAAATNLWDWSSVVHGGGPVPSSRSQIKENPDTVNEEESIESQGVSMGSQPLSEYGLDDVMPVQHGDLTSLKGELVKLLESSNGRLRLSCLASEYQKSFNKPLRVSDYKAPKLVDLLKKTSDVISVEKFVILKNDRVESSDVFSED